MEKNEGRNSKSGQAAIDKLTLAITPISKIEDDEDVKQEIKTASTCLLNHLEILKSTFNSLTTTNREKINKATSGTLSVPQRSLSAIIETIPPFSGDDSPDAVSWLDFHIAVEHMELHNFNRKDSVIQFLNKIQNPARRMITTQDKETSVQEIFQKLKAIFGTPKKVRAKIIQDHFRVGSIPETGMGLIFHALSQHQDLLDKTNTYLKSFKEKDIEEATTTLRLHAYDLYTMLPPSVIIQANKFLIQNG